MVELSAKLRELYSFLLIDDLRLMHAVLAENTERIRIADVLMDEAAL